MDAQQLMFALQSPVGLRFGATIQVDADRVTFEMDLKIPKGTECPFRMELSGSEHTIMGTVRIEKLLPKRGTGPPRYIARIIEMPHADRSAFGPVPGRHAAHLIPSEIRFSLQAEHFRLYAE